MFFFLETRVVLASCTEAPNCTELGFTQTEEECSNGSIKCPWNTGLVYCRNKQNMPCAIGLIYYDDHTCSTELLRDKTPLGVVVHINPNGIGGQVMSAWPIDEDGNKSKNNVGISWGSKKDIESLQNYTSVYSNSNQADAAANNFSSCENTDKILAEFQANPKDTFPAAQASRKYAPTKDTTGKWCLPAAGVMSTIHINIDAIQKGISKLGGIALPNCCTWSSTEYGSDNAWFYQSDKSSYGLGDGVPQVFYSGNFKTGYYYVRPVLEF